MYLKIEEIVKLNYYHKYTAFILAGCSHFYLSQFYLARESSQAHINYLIACAGNIQKHLMLVAGDGLYLNGSTFKLLESYHKYTTAVLKDETRYLYDEAISLSKITTPVVYEEENITYRVWDHKIEGMWDWYRKPVRVIKSEETKTVRRYCDTLRKWDYFVEKANWMWVTNLPRVFSTRSIISICHARWQIENNCFS